MIDCFPILHLQIVPSWLEIHITDAGVINGAVFEHTSSRVLTTTGDNWERVAMCDSVLDHLQIVPTWVVVHVTDASAVSGVAFDCASSEVPTTTGANWERVTLCDTILIHLQIMSFPYERMLRSLTPVRLAIVFRCVIFKSADNC